MKLIKVKHQMGNVFTGDIQCLDCGHKETISGRRTAKFLKDLKTTPCSKCEKGIVK